MPRSGPLGRKHHSRLCEPGGWVRRGAGPSHLPGSVRGHINLYARHRPFISSGSQSFPLGRAIVLNVPNPVRLMEYSVGLTDHHYPIALELRPGERGHSSVAQSKGAFDPCSPSC